ncbi:MAG: hypothetical protein V4736_03265, partial [Bdellovibrionota bacterium]
SIMENPTYAVRQSINEKLGFGFMTAPLASYQPLGGYPGLELGIDYHRLDLTSLVDQGYIRGSDSLDFMALTLAKGLYYDIDFRFSASIMPQTTTMQFFSGMLRWKFYEHPSWARLTAVIHYSGASFPAATHPTATPAAETNYATQGQGYDLVVSRGFGSFELFGGVGRARSVSQFLVDVTVGQKAYVRQDDTLNRYTAGSAIKWKNGSFSFGMDRVVQNKYFIQTQFELL